jgi:hypothetical protein
VFVVNGQTLSAEILKELKQSFPAATFVLYMWDSIGNRRSVVENLEFFDLRFSFDPRAVEQYGFRFRPLFFSKGFEAQRGSEFDYDISFIGTAHTDRYAVVAAIEASLEPEIRRFWYLYLQAPWVFHAYRLTNSAFKKARAGDFRFAPLARADVQDVFRRSKAILDIEHPRQSGLTIRTFEAMGAAKKLVTTNAAIAGYDFFDPANICIVERGKARVSADFLHQPYRPIAAECYAKYSLAGWLDEILEG